MTLDAIVAQVRAVQYAARSLDVQCAALLKSLEEPVTQKVVQAATPVPPTPSQSPSALDPQGVCIHPEKQRLPAAAMGAPHRFFCQLCERTIDPDNKAPEEAK